jgi:hypothetical protein
VILCSAQRRVFGLLTSLKKEIVLILRKTPDFFSFLLQEIFPVLWYNQRQMVSTGQICNYLTVGWLNLFQIFLFISEFFGLFGCQQIQIKLVGGCQYHSKA